MKRNWREKAAQGFHTVCRYFPAIMLFFVCSDAYAQVGGWLSGLSGITCNLQEAARYFALAGIVMFGILVMKMEIKGWIHDLMLLLFGISIIVFAGSFLQGIFPSAGFSSLNCA